MEHLGYEIGQLMVSGQDFPFDQRGFNATGLCLRNFDDEPFLFQRKTIPPKYPKIRGECHFFPAYVCIPSGIEIVDLPIRLSSVFCLFTRVSEHTILMDIFIYHYDIMII